MKMKQLSVIFVVACVVAPSAVAQQFGTLFTTPEEREYLDYLRDDFLERTAEAGFDIDDDAVPDIPVDEEPIEEVVEFHLDGIMTQSDGGRTVWLNGSPIFEGDLPSNASILRVDGVTALQLLTAEKGYILKPGQTVNVSTGEFWEAYESSGISASAGNVDDESATEIVPEEQEFIEEGTDQDISPMQLIESLQFFQEVENE